MRGVFLVPEFPCLETFSLVCGQIGSMGINKNEVNNLDVQSNMRLSLI